jgi:toxin ParE1/3/4
MAETDLSQIATYILDRWGQDQAANNISGLEACCRQLLKNLELGRACDYIRPGLRRMEYGRHILFYRIEQGGIFVSRILHQRMLPEGKSIEDESLPGKK